MKHVVSFSGGKDSTALLLMLLEKGMPVDRVVCVDTTKEFPQMYNHIQKVQDYIAPLKIEIVKMAFDYWFGERIMTKGKRKGEQGYGWPDSRVRWCTGRKVQLYTTHLLGNPIVPHKTPSQAGASKIGTKWVEYLGISFDERHRAEKFYKHPHRNVKVPLIDWGITGEQALAYCYDKGFDWGGLYDKLHRVSCWCCPLARLSELEIVHDQFPALWAKIKEMDKKSFRHFKHRYPLYELEKRFRKTAVQPSDIKQKSIFFDPAPLRGRK